MCTYSHFLRIAAIEFIEEQLSQHHIYRETKRVTETDRFTAGIDKTVMRTQAIPRTFSISDKYPTAIDPTIPPISKNVE